MRGQSAADRVALEIILEQRREEPYPKLNCSPFKSFIDLAPCVPLGMARSPGALELVCSAEHL